MTEWATGGTFKELSRSNFAKIKIPLPPLPIQESIVRRLETERSEIEMLKAMTARIEGQIKEKVAGMWGE
jgi:type I restriction enzyme M protein